MSSSIVEKQPFPVRVLNTHVRKDRVAHTYLLTGKQDSGREDLALAFASALNDEEGLEFGDLSGRNGNRITTNQYPDMLWVGEDATARSIKISEVRKSVEWSHLRCYEGKWKIVIVRDAERLTVEAQNAFLKTLEEPPAHTVFCLLVENKERLLETIRSRSFELRLQPLSDDLAELAERVPAEFGRKRWEDFFEAYNTEERIEVKALLDSLTAYLRACLIRSASSGEGSEFAWAWIRSLEVLLESKQALNENANQKLTLTRLAMLFKELLPNPEMVRNG
ncbi:MAG: hypothetical protein Q8R76_02630 [Candidatus Omnitrophota bacterium]|nr:hypothetical protein [Candidatus Omnitrophota bacterium]